MEDNETVAENLIGDFNPNERKDVASIKQAAKDFVMAIERQCPDPRRKAIAFTHIEEAAMMAVKGLFSGG